MYLVRIAGDLEAVDGESADGFVVEVEAEVQAAQQLSLVLVDLEGHVKEI